MLRLRLICLHKYREAIKAIERAADVRTSLLTASRHSNSTEKKLVSGIPVSNLFRGGSVSAIDAPLEYNMSRKPQLGDRVINLTSVGVPFGLRGTVVVLHSHTGFVEVVFDEEFVNGKSLNGYCSPFRGKLVPWTRVLRVPQAEVAVPKQNNNKQSVDSHSVNNTPVSVVTASSNAPSNAKSNALKSVLIHKSNAHESVKASKSDKQGAVELLKKSLGTGVKQAPSPDVPPQNIKILTRDANYPPAPPMSHLIQGYAALAAAATGNVVEVGLDDLNLASPGVVHAINSSEDTVHEINDGGRKVVRIVGKGVDLTTKDTPVVLEGPQIAVKVNKPPKEILQRPSTTDTNSKQAIVGGSGVQSEKLPKSNKEKDKERSNNTHSSTATAKNATATGSVAGDTSNKGKQLLHAIQSKPDGVSSADSSNKLKSIKTATSDNNNSKKLLSLLKSDGNKSSTVNNTSVNMPIVESSTITTSSSEVHSNTDRQDTNVTVINTSTIEDTALPSTQTSTQANIIKSTEIEKINSNNNKKIVPTSVLLHKK